MTRSRNILNTPQQQLAGEDCPSTLRFKLDRACTVHSLAAASILLGKVVSIQEVVDFVNSNGAETGSAYYSEGHGWRSVELADEMRQKGFTIIAQNLNIHSDEMNLDAAQFSGRIKTESEAQVLQEYAQFGTVHPEERQKWWQPIGRTVTSGGLVLTSVQIPLLSGNGEGGHSVLITDHDQVNQNVTYFDPDIHYLDRYKEPKPPISKIDTDKLLYERPAEDMQKHMSGEVIHIWQRDA